LPPGEKPLGAPLDGRAIAGSGRPRSLGTAEPGNRRGAQAGLPAQRELAGKPIIAFVHQLSSQSGGGCLMTLFAHHMAVELFGREFSPHGVFQHACAFLAIGMVLGLSVYGGWTLATK